MVKVVNEDAKSGGYRAHQLQTSNDLDFSIITVVYNGEKYIEHTIQSVMSQKKKKVEHIIIDGGSTDGTVAILRKYSDKVAYWISEEDKGIYDGMNKGIRLAHGKYVGILNSDDYYEHENVLNKVFGILEDASTRCVFAHVRFIDPQTKKTVRVYNSKSNPEKLFRWGFMPAHPTFFAHRDDYLKYGLYKIDYKIAADYELLIRFILKFKLPYKRLDEVIIVMRTGGASTGGLKSTIHLNKEIIRACRDNGIYTNFLMLSLKYFRKVAELLPAATGRHNRNSQ